MSTNSITLASVFKYLLGHCCLVDAAYYRVLFKCVNQLIDFFLNKAGFTV